MDEELVQVRLTTRTGQQTGFSASAVERVTGGYKFISYPEKRGYKKMIVVKDDAIATISIEAPEPFFEAIKFVDPAGVVQHTVTSAANYPEGDPTTAVNPILRRVREEAMAKAVKTEHGTPASVVKLDGREIQVGAAMIGGVPK